MGSKSFEISMEEAGGKLIGKVLGRSKSFPLWIRFGELFVYWKVWKLVARIKMGSGIAKFGLKMVEFKLE